MIEQFDSIMIGVAIVLWPAAKSVAFIGAAAISIFSPDEATREAARRVIRLIHPGADRGRRDDE